MTKPSEARLARQEVYRVIDSERRYQEDLGPSRTDGRAHRVEGYLVMLERYLRKAFDAWTDNAGDQACLEQMRKIAAIAVHCMEDHGAPLRVMDTTSVGRRKMAPPM